MATIGTAHLNVVPKLKGLDESVKAAFKRIDADSLGKTKGREIGGGMGRGLTASGAVIGAFSAVTSKAMDAVSSSVGGAIKRFDTLNNYPRVMQSLGYSAEDAQSSIELMSKRLTGLPTALNDMASTVQGLSVITKDLPKATEAGLALNDMLLASGSSQQLVNAAMEQFRQMLAKGKPDMQDWKSLTQAMPGQMDQLAKAMLGPTAGANDLYAALGGGGADPTLTMDDLLQAMIRLDQEGGENFASFEQQARQATGGVDTSMQNMQTSIVRGMAKVLDAIGGDAISKGTSAIGKGFEAALTKVADVIREVRPVAEGFVGIVGKIGPALVPAAAGVASMAAAGRAVQGIAGIVEHGVPALNAIKDTARGASDAFGKMAKAAGEGSRAQKALSGVSSVLGSAMGGPLVLGITAAAAGIGMLAKAVYDAKVEHDRYEAATTGLTDAVGRISECVGPATGAFDSLRNGAERNVATLDELRRRADESTEAHIRLADSVNSKMDGLQANIGLLETYKETIEKYANQSGLTTREQAELKLAVDEVNKACGTQYEVVDAANGKIADQEGAIQKTTEAINENIEAIERKLRVEALQDMYKDAYKVQYQDAQNLAAAKDTLAKAQEKYNKAYDDWVAAGSKTGREGELPGNIRAFASEMKKAKEEVEECEGKLDSSTKTLDGMSDQMIDASTGADVMRATMEAMGGKVSDAVSAMGTDVGKLSEDLVGAGVSTSDLRNVGEENFAAMLEACGGDITKLAGMIEVYNATPIIDKDGNVNIDDAKLVDAQGKVYTWNGSELVDKDGTALVDDTELTDAQGNLYTWNGSSLTDQWGNAFIKDKVPASQQNLERWNQSDLEDADATAEVSGNMSYANGEKAEWNREGLADWVGSGVISITKRITEFFGGGHASGGIRLHADGGVRMHAGGAIVRKAVPLDIVGEDGAEAIVPLTNKRYVRPFAQTVAEEMRPQPNVEYAALAAKMDEIVDALNGMGVYMDAEKVGKVVSPSVNEALGRFREAELR